MYDNMHTNYTHVCTNDNVSRTLVYSKKKNHSSEIFLNAIYWFWRSISLHSFEWTLVHKSMNIHVGFCFLLQSGEELHGSSVHSGEHHTDFLHCCHHLFGLDEQEANSRLEGKILPTNIQSFAILVIFKIQWFGAPCPLSSRSRPNYWTLQCILHWICSPTISIPECHHHMILERQGWEWCLSLSHLVTCLEREFELLS